MTDSDTAKTERPLVTFALFAYNQERYIREAVEGAFAQTYEPLEIILSDDSSTDRTFEIMQEMAAAYSGPHRIVLNQNEANLGIVDHVIKVSRMLRGELLVVAAGDDISYPERAEKLFLLWQKGNPGGLNSNYDEIDEFGHVIRRNVEKRNTEWIKKYFVNCKTIMSSKAEIRGISGFCAAYNPDVFRDLPYSNKRIHNEDALSSIIVNVKNGAIKHCSESLLKYRIHKDTLTPRYSSITYNEIENFENKLEQSSRNKERLLEYVLCVINDINHPDKVNLIKNIEDRRRYSSLRASYSAMRFPDRAKALMKSRSFEEIKFCLLRIFGQKAFVISKVYYYRYVKKQT